MKDLIRIVSVESEVQTLDSLKYILENSVDDAQLIKNYARPDIFLHDCKAGMHDFDLLFLDFDVFSVDGLELIDKIKKNSAFPHFDVVFLTLKDNFVLNTFRNHAVDYLHKPLIPEELQFCLKNWKKKNFPCVDPTQNQFSHELLEQPNKARNQLAIPTVEGYEIIDIDQIIRCEADRNYTYVHVLGMSKPYLISKNLKDLEKALSPNGFVRIHNSHLINPIYMKKILRVDGGFVQMIDGSKIKLSRNKGLTQEKLFINITKI